MTHFSHIPLVRVLLPFMTGIILFLNITYFAGTEIMAGMLLIFLLAGIVVYLFVLPRFGLRSVFGILVMLIMVAAGYFLAQSRYELSRTYHFSRFSQEGTMLRIKLTEPPSEKPNSVKLIGKVMHIVSDSIITRTTGRLIIWLQKDSSSINLTYGDVILIENTVQQVQPPRNPNVFDYRKYLQGQNIFHQTYRRAGEWSFTGSNEGLKLLAAAHYMRAQALLTLEKNNITGREFAVASALLLGYKEYLDENLQREFAGAGAMHILCVSGLHVGIIYMVLNLVLGFLNRKKYGPLIKTIIIVILIWFYAAITGFSPSVKRASTMFTFLAFGLALNRSTNIYNTLAGSALFLMLTDPFIITRLGFQLSYSAVIGIVWLQPYFRSITSFENRILQYGWEIITVSVAAQLATVPLTLYYFNQFPNYFMITNLIVIPLTGVIIKAGIIFFIISVFPVAPMYAGWILSKLVLIMHRSVAIIEGLPGSTLEHVSINFHDMLLIFSATAFLGIYLGTRRRAAIFIFTSMLLFLALSVSFQKVANQNLRQLVVYHVPRATAVDIIKDGRLYLYSSEEVVASPSLTRFNMYENRLKAGLGGKMPVHLNQVENPLPNDVYSSHGYINVDGHTIKILTRREELVPEKSFPFTIDHVILSRNASLRVSEVAAAFSPRQIIIDSSNNFRRSNTWLSECDSLGIPCWSVPHSGAYVFNF
jgi:competence protein ComEC